MDDPVPAPGDRELLAAELALGVLEGDVLAEARRRQLADPAFAEEVAAWEHRLAEIALDTPDVEPVGALWSRIEAAIAREEEPAAPTDIALARMQRRLRRWQVGAVGIGAVAAALALVLIVPRETPAPDAPVGVASGPAIVAQLRGAGEGPVIAARYDPDTAQLRLSTSGMPQSDLAPELWIIPGDGVPRSLGLIAAAGGTELTVAQGHRAMMADGATLAVTMEPRATAPHAAPSGAPVASGKIFGI